MQGVTLIVATITSFFVFLVPPVYTLIAYVAALAWYPQYLTVPVGTVDFTVRRIVILAVFAKLFLQTDLPARFKFIWLDKLVIVYFAAQLLSGATTTTSLAVFLENRAGAVFDMVLPYFAVRMILTTKEQYLTLLKGILCLAIPLACLGLYQSITGYNVLEPLQSYAAWGMETRVQNKEIRYGFYRANVTFLSPIMFGLFFAMFGPVCASLLRGVKRHKVLSIAGLVFMAIGVFSSMSAGPWLSGFLTLLFIAFYRYRRHWKAAAVTIIILCSTVEIISNRHFYEVIDRFTFSASTAWYRSRLIQVALFEGGMSGHWLFGYGPGSDPGWGPSLIGTDHTDMVNHYLRVLSSYGLVGLVPFLVVIIASIKRLIQAFRMSVSESDTWLAWCLFAALLGLAATTA